MDKTITARYTSRCPNCGQTLQAGSPALWAPGQKARHQVCPKPWTTPPVTQTQQTAPRRCADCGGDGPNGGICADSDGVMRCYGCSKARYDERERQQAVKAAQRSYAQAGRQQAAQRGQERGWERTARELEARQAVAPSSLEQAKNASRASIAEVARLMREVRQAEAASHRYYPTKAKYYAAQREAETLAADLKAAEAAMQAAQAEFRRLRDLAQAEASEAK